MAMFACNNPNAKIYRSPAIKNDSIEQEYILFDRGFTNAKSVKIKYQKRDTIQGISSWKMHINGKTLSLIIDTSKFKTKDASFEKRIIYPLSQTQYDVNGKSYKIFKYYLDDPGCVDEEKTIYLCEDFGPIYEITAWGYYIKLFHTENNKSDFTINSLIDILRSDSDFYNKIGGDTTKFIPPKIK